MRSSADLTYLPLHDVRLISVGIVCVLWSLRQQDQRAENAVTDLGRSMFLSATTAVCDRRIQGQKYHDDSWPFNGSVKHGPF